METNSKIKEVLAELKDFFDQHDENDWSLRTQRAIQKINESEVNTSIILNDFVGAGMGSLIDLYICSDNGHQLQQNEADTNKLLERLTEQVLIIKHSLEKRRKASR